MKKKPRRTPRNYDGTESTSRHLSHVLPEVLSQISHRHAEGSALVLAVWPQIIGDKLCAMARAHAFRDGVLQVKVKNSTLLSLLSQYDKERLIREIKRKCPRVKIHDIRFRIG